MLFVLAELLVLVFAKTEELLGILMLGMCTAKEIRLIESTSAHWKWSIRSHIFQYNKITIIKKREAFLFFASDLCEPRLLFRA